MSDSEDGFVDQSGGEEEFDYEYDDEEEEEEVDDENEEAIEVENSFYEGDGASQHYPAARRSRLSSQSSGMDRLQGGQSCACAGAVQQGGGAGEEAEGGR